ncbi:hypothetical protein [Actinoplanes aureus]|uniref:PH domain-containing protein n=1 Tax=Actinoplanes aureus TaxID=2792083 RepID=A0A931CEE3_9ACTN|nr:hypothetical protein [Actinoplanes aureus]MBG0565673.1 hypothetical protein [Actinoplanes aureus]
MMQPTHDPFFRQAASAGLPDNWPHPARPLLLMFGGGYFILMTAGVLAGAGWAASAGDPVTAILLAAAAVYLGHLAGATLSHLRYPRRGGSPPMLGVDDHAEQGLTFTYARMPYYWLFSLLAMTVLVLVAAVIATAASGPPGGWIMAAVATAAIAYLVWYIAGVLHRAPGRVVLTPAGIYHRSLAAEYFTPWDAVYDVEVATDQPMIVIKAYPSPRARQNRFAGRRNRFEEQFLPFLVIGAYWLGANARPTYQALDHYLRHPEQRTVLNSTAALNT